MNPPIDAFGDTHDVSLVVNGERVNARVGGRSTLADLLRDELQLTGTHLACEQGWCGACTVLVDGCSARACLMLSPQADGCEVTTAEGLESADGVLNPVQSAFVERHALQCGFCTPGMVILGTEILAEARAGASFTRQQLMDRVAANVCRCTGYAPIVEALEDVLAQLDAEGGDDGRG